MELVRSEVVDACVRTPSEILALKTMAGISRIAGPEQITESPATLTGRPVPTMSRDLLRMIDEISLFHKLAVRVYRFGVACDNA